MKALTIHQPYAHWILSGEKPVENRTWRVGYYGPLLIHAGKSRESVVETHEARMAAAGTPLAFGAIVGRALMVDCLRADRYREMFPEHADSEHVFGPWCFVLVQPVRFAAPIPYRGAQGLFDVPDEILPTGGGSV